MIEYKFLPQYQSSVNQFNSLGRSGWVYRGQWDRPSGIRAQSQYLVFSRDLVAKADALEAADDNTVALVK